MNSMLSTGNDNVSILDHVVWNEHRTAWLAGSLWPSTVARLSDRRFKLPDSDSGYTRFPRPVATDVLELSRELGVEVAAVVLARLIGLWLAPSRTNRRAPDDGWCEVGVLAEYLVENGFIWTSATQALGSAPDGLPPLVEQEEWRECGGCGHYTTTYIEQDGRMEHWVGWLLFPGEEGKDPLWTWAHEWCVAPGGVLIDPTLGTCGVRPGFAYIGTTRKAELDLSDAWDRKCQRAAATAARRRSTRRKRKPGA